MKTMRQLMIFCCLLQVSNAFSQKSTGILQWITTGDSTMLFQQLNVIPAIATSGNAAVITIDDAKKFQTIDGFGFALTQGSALPISKMTAASRAALLHELFDTVGKAIGVSYIRLSIGASDLNEQVFSYDDMPGGQTDEALAHFDLGPDRNDVIPVMKDILQINPHIKILGSPWSPPAWMKTNNDTRGGRLKHEYYAAYANYFVKYIKAMAQEGIIIDAVTLQNEPLHPGNNPSLLMTAPEQAEFIKDHVGPAFQSAGIKTKIILYDHNADRPDYPIYILDDTAAAKYVDGSGFHLYNGEVSALTDVHNAHPAKHIYFTEQMVVQFGERKNDDSPKFGIARPVEEIFIGATRNWSRNVLEWNLAANSAFTPFTDRGGCSMCQGAVSVDGDIVTRNLAYYAMAHFSKFVRPGSVRIASNELNGLPNVAFKTPDNKTILIVANTSKQTQVFNIRFQTKNNTVSLAAKSVATYILN